MVREKAEEENTERFLLKLVQQDYVLIHSLYCTQITMIAKIYKEKTKKT